MRYSEQRETVFQIVRNTKVHPTAEWVFEKAQLTLPTISRGTVYRNLGQLDDEGKIRSFAMKGKIRYDGNMENHSHFICRECDLMLDIHPEKLYKNFSRDLPENFTAESMDLKITGVCRNCNTHSNIKRN
jgi:Fur family ferric uptake transcriptional regulator/Fur family peroxide stress response transcriptional regulator